MSLLYDCANCRYASPHDLVTDRNRYTDYTCLLKRHEFPSAIGCPSYKQKDSQPTPDLRKE